LDKLVRPHDRQVLHSQDRQVFWPRVWAQELLVMGTREDCLHDKQELCFVCFDVEVDVDVDLQVDVEVELEGNVDKLEL